MRQCVFGSSLGPPAAAAARSYRALLARGRAVVCARLGPALATGLAKTTTRQRSEAGNAAH